MKINVKHNNQWVKPKNFFVKINGVWQSYNKLGVKYNGQWIIIKNLPHTYQGLTDNEFTYIDCAEYTYKEIQDE